MCKRVVVTGIGLLTPLGNSAKEFFDNAIRGKNCVGPIRKFDASVLPVRFGGEVDFSAQELNLPEERLAEMPTTARWAVAAARKAVEDAGLETARADPYAAAVVLGVCGSTISHIPQYTLEAGSAGVKALSGKTVVLSNPTAAAIQICRDLGLHGEAVNLTSACSSSASALGYAFRMIRYGEAEWVLTGGADEGLTPLFLGGFGNAKCLSLRNDDPAGASRPFERNRDGIVLSDAACILVLEEYERAKRRSAEIYCEITGYGGSADGTTAFKLAESEEPGARAVERALAQAGRARDAVDHYNAVGVADPWLDVRETRMVKRVFRRHARRVAMSSLKSMMGHPLGASGAVQAAGSALAVRRGVIPPTINYEIPDPACDLDYVPNRARERRVRNSIVYTLGNTCNAALVFSAC